MENPDSLFRSGELLLPTGPVPEAMTAAAPELSAMIIQEVVIIATILISILYLKQITIVMPSAFACLLRWKECINLENSVKLSRARNIFTVILVLPFVLAIYAEGIIAPEFSGNWGVVANLAIVLMYLLIYQGLRILAHAFCRPKKLSGTQFSYSFRTFHSFFIIAALLLFMIQGISAIFDIEKTVSIALATSEIGAVFLLFLIRKTQIFMVQCSFLSAILYLCALEILPAAFLTAAAIFL